MQSCLDTNPVDAAINALGEFLQSQMSELKQVLYQFPTESVHVQFPSLTISYDTTNSYQAQNPQLISNTVPDAQNRVKSVYVVGQWDFKIQLDFWTTSIPARIRLFNAFFSAFNRLTNGTMGLNLPLPKYGDVICRYDMDGFKFMDTVQSSQLQEYRLMVSIMANVKNILTQSEFAIVDPILTSGNTPLDNPDELDIIVGTN